ncbi:MAG TPA: energy transducer TonB [Candidatus Sulfotelmatobacter sp.]|jgi:protein TonB|nr:energy transducer TonB [Candidatus Sulfotelmatobacter sp.]
MSLEVQRVSHVSEDAFGSLRSCLVEGDPQSEKRARRIKQRALAISIVLQSLALVAIVLFPLLSKGERISLKNATPIPPYSPVGDRRPSTTPPRHGMHAPPVCRFCVPQNIPPTIVSHDQTTTAEREDSLGDPIPGLSSSPGTPGGVPSTISHPGPRPPVDPPPTVVRRSVSELQQMAQLITRVEPKYPPLAIQTRREGRVELHALISTTGTIESLEVISGDPFFIQSALAAVSEWRYKPTILNNRPIEVDTRITVIYTLSH